MAESGSGVAIPSADFTSFNTTVNGGATAATLTRVYAQDSAPNDLPLGTGARSLMRDSNIYGADENVMAETIAGDALGAPDPNAHSGNPVDQEARSEG